MINGQRLNNRYVLHERVGIGGMGEVWRARDTALNRFVAIKLLHPSLCKNDVFRTRFQQEARTIAALNAPGIVDIYDIGEDISPNQHHVYLVMRYVTGLPLSSIIAEYAPLSPHEVFPILAQVARALDAAHAANIVHRDIKPENILVDETGNATVIDFGIARRHGDTALTATGSVMGTVDYASPEQLRDETLTGASDLYSLGVVGYECLTKQSPFARSSTAATIMSHLHESALPLPHHLPAAVSGVIFRALAKNPADRFPSAREFAEACTDAVSVWPVSHARMITAPIPTATKSLTYTDMEDDRELKRKRPVKLLVAVVSAIAMLAVGGAVFVNSMLHSNADPVEETTHDETTNNDIDLVVPTASVIVSASAKSCLLMFNDNGSVEPQLGLCDSSPDEIYHFYQQDDAIRIEVTPPDGGKVMCLSGGDATLWLVECAGIKASNLWRFQLLDSADVDFWQIHSVDGENLCLTESGENVILVQCDGTENQQWRTDRLRLNKDSTKLCCD